MREKIVRFMQGRYGVDSFGKFLLVSAIVLSFASAIDYLGILAVFAWVLLCYSYFRMMSRNYVKRSAENQLFLGKTYGLRRKFSSLKQQLLQSRYYHIYKCPGCRQKIRIPRGKGKIEVRCPKCGTTFIKRS